MKRDCACPRARHQHGSVGAYRHDHCGCFACRVAYANATREWRCGRSWNEAQPPLSAIGSARRLQALAVNGWSSNDIAPLLGLRTNRYLNQIRSGDVPVVTPRTAQRIAALYDQIWDKPAPGKYAVKIRNLADREGWLPPMGLDDDRIDDPDYQPHMPTHGPWDHQPCGSDAAYRRHLRNGEKPCLACNSANRIRKADAEAKRKAAA